MEQFQCGEIRDEITGEIIDIDWDLQPCQCQFCCENKSSIYNRGTVGIFDLQGLIDTLGPKDIMPIEVNFGNQKRTTLHNLSEMHGKRIAVFKQVKVEHNGTSKELLYDFHFEGRCIGRCIFNKEGEKHDVNLDTFHYVYFKAFSRDGHTEYHLTVSLGL